MDATTRCNNAAKAALHAIADHVDPLDRTEVLIASESFLMGLMILIADGNLLAQREYLDALTERVLGRLADAASKRLP